MSPIFNRGVVTPPPAAGAPEAPRRSAVPDTVTNVGKTDWLQPGALVGRRYRIVALAGIGGMGIVYKAHDEELSVDVALKVLRPEFAIDPAGVQRFKRELVLARQVSHPRVVRIHDIGESEGLRFLTMDYVEGRSLLEVLRADGPLPVPRAARIIADVADALQRAHDAGIVHRDLKPANILIAPDDSAYVTDFGIARSIHGEGPTRAGAIVGTPDYLSPEQIAGAAVDHRSDIYALGLLLCEMLTGRVPLRGATPAELLAVRLAGSPRVVPGTEDLPPRVAAAIGRALDRDPDRRHQHARELAAAIDDPGRRPSGPWVRRAAAAALGAVLLLAPGWWAVNRWRASGEPAAARRAAVPAPAAAVASPSHALIVLPFVRETADPSLSWADTGLPDILSASLAESASLRVLDARRVVQVLRDLKRDAAAIGDADMRRVAALLNADTVLAGSVRQAGPRVRIDVRLAGPGPAGEVRRFSAEAPDVSRLFAMVGDIASQVRAALEASPPAAIGTVQAASRSAEATAAYFDGRARLQRGETVAAAPLLERAVAADPGFAGALDALSEAYQALGRTDDAIAAAERAVAAIGDAPTRLAWRARARLATLRGQPADAVKSLEALAASYPNDTEVLLDLATAQGAQGDVAAAVGTLKRVTALDGRDPRAWFLLGKFSILSGDSRAAVNEYLVRALTLQNDLQNVQGQGEAANAMGIACHELGDYARAIEYYGTAAERRRAAGDRRGVATTLKNRARTLMAMGRHDEAAADLGAARRLHAGLGDRAGVADVVNDLGVLHEGRGAYDQALGAYREALRIRREFGDERLLAQSYDNIGYVHFVKGEYDAAPVYWQQALDLRRKLGDERGVIASTQNMGFLQLAQGRWDEATRGFLEALDRSRAIDFKNAAAVSFGNLGVLHQYAGRYEAALESFDEAVALLEALGDVRGVTEYTIAAAAALAEIGDGPAAGARLDAAASRAATVGNPEQLADLQTVRADWHRLRGDARLAVEAARQAVASARKSGSAPAILRARIGEALAVGDAGDPGRAAARLRAIVREADALGHVVLRLRSREALARMRLQAGQPGPAEAAAREARALAQKVRWDAGLYRLHGLLAEALAARGAHGEAERAFQESLAAMPLIRDHVAAPRRAAFDALPAVRSITSRTGAAANRLPR